MLYVTYQNIRYAINVKELKKTLKKLIFKGVAVLLFIGMFFYLTFDFCHYPEKYLTTWKYQLHNEIKSGNQEAVDYYNNVYVSHGIKLFDD